MVAPKKVVAEFSIPYVQFLDAEAHVVSDLPAFAQDLSTLQTLYRWLVRTRHFDQKAINLQRTGKMGTYAASQGQEAIGVGIGHALLASDVYVPSYRDYGALLQRGIKMSEIYAYWGGDERGSAFSCGNQDFPLCVPIATQCLHASGIATAMQIRQENRAVVVTVGDGGTSEGDFYEAINVAGVWKLPVVFVVCNNQWAISVPAAKQSAVQAFAQKGIAAGMPVMQIDGNDVIAVTHTLTAALEKARQGEGPTLIEAMTYRLHDHTTADDATRYRTTAEREAALHKEPIARLKKYLYAQSAWDDAQETALQEQCRTEVENAVEEYLAMGTEPITAMFDYLFETLPVGLYEQREQALAYPYVGGTHD